MEKILALSSLTPPQAEMLMDVYGQSNKANGPMFFPACKDERELLCLARQAHVAYLQEDFFSSPGNRCYVLEAEGKYLSALRLYALEGFYYIEALETPPSLQNRGYASKLLRGVLSALQEQGPFLLRDAVDKHNAPSLAVHKKCGFIMESEEAADPFGGGSDHRSYQLLCEYKG